MDADKQQEWIEWYTWIADEWELGDPAFSALLIGMRDKLLSTHREYLANCAEGFSHEDAVEGTRRCAIALYGRKPNGEPYWSNNERRRAGLGPMPIRGLLIYRNRNRG